MSKYLTDMQRTAYLASDVETTEAKIQNFTETQFQTLAELIIFPKIFEEMRLH